MIDVFLHEIIRKLLVTRYVLKDAISSNCIFTLEEFMHFIEHFRVKFFLVHVLFEKCTVLIL